MSLIFLNVALDICPYFFMLIFVSFAIYFISVLFILFTGQSLYKTSWFKAKSAKRKKSILLEMASNLCRMWSWQGLHTWMVFIVESASPEMYFVFTMHWNTPVSSNIAKELSYFKRINDSFSHLLKKVEKELI